MKEAWAPRRFEDSKKVGRFEVKIMQGGLRAQNNAVRFKG